MTDLDVSTGQDAHLDRRGAMKAALGGAAAAAVFAAPKVSSLSQAPSYAAAASCDIPNSFTDRYTSTGGSAVNYCWGAWGNDTTCLSGNYGPSAVGTLVDTFQGTWSGNPFVGGGAVTVQKASGTRSCTVTVTGECGTGAGAWVGDTATYPLTATLQSISLGCAGSCTSCVPYGAKATLTVACIC